MRSRTRAAVSALFAVCFLATACGARLTAQQRAAGIGALNQGSGNGTFGPTQTINPSTGPSAAGSLGGSGLGATTGGATTGGNAAVGACKAGKGGATDKGVTAGTINLATIADVSGVQPGLFKSAWQAMDAFRLYVNSTGGICGRQVNVEHLDSKTDSTANRAAVQQACTDAFASVGSMSAFDDGGASAGQSCGIPDLSAITVNPSRSDATNVYPAYPVSPHYLNSAWGLYIKQKYPDAIKHAGFITLNAGASVSNGEQRIRGLTKIGYNFVYKQRVQVVEGNYTPYVQQMRDAGVQFIDMVSDYQSTVRLQQAMESQNWFPAVRVWDSAVYSSAYVTQGGTAVQSRPNSPALLFIDTAMLEEPSGNPELQLYETWLQRAAPGAKPDYFGEYAWSAGRLFQKAATMVGPDLTRKALFTAIKSIHAWNDYGLHVTHDIGNKREGNCVMFAEVKNSQFVRVSPASGWTCQGKLIPTG